MISHIIGEILENEFWGRTFHFSQIHEPLMGKHKMTCEWYASVHMWSTEVMHKQSPALRGCMSARCTALQLQETLLVNSYQSAHYHSYFGFTPQWQLYERSSWQRSTTHSFFPTLCMWEVRGGNVASDQTVADACISSAATNKSVSWKSCPFVLLPLYVCEWVSQWVCMSVWSHARTNANEKDCSHCVTCVLLDWYY